MSEKRPPVCGRGASQNEGTVSVVGRMDLLQYHYFYDGVPTSRPLIPTRITVTMGTVYVRSPGTLPTVGQIGVITPPYCNSSSTLWSKEKSFRFCPDQSSTILKEPMNRVVSLVPLRPKDLTGRTFPDHLQFSFSCVSYIGFGGISLIIGTGKYIHVS